MNQRSAPSALGRKAVGEHRDDGVEVGALQIAVRPGAPHEGEELVLAVLAARRLRHDLLRQNVERRIV